MSYGSSLILGINTAIIGMGIVFLVLVFLSLIISLESKLLTRQEKEKAIIAAASELPAAEEKEKKWITSSGAPFVSGVEDEDTLAVIMAAVSAVSGISLDKMQFQSITLAANECNED